MRQGPGTLLECAHVPAQTVSPEWEIGPIFKDSWQPATLLAPSLVFSQRAMRLKAALLLGPTQAIESQQPQEPENNKTLPAAPEFLSILSILSIPFCITMGVSVPTALEEMGLKESRNLSSQLPQSGVIYFTAQHSPFPADRTSIIFLISRDTVP